MASGGQPNQEGNGQEATRRSDRQKVRVERQVRTRQRADAFFGIYYEMGPDRSLEKLCDFCAKIGLKRTLNTFKRWSSDYGWQNRVVELDSRTKEERDRTHVATIQAMNERQAQDFRNAQALARAGMTALAQEVQRSGRLDLSPIEIMTLLEKGARGERLAMGEATDRLEAMIYVYNVMVLAILDIFREVNAIPSERKRMQIFTSKVDDLRHTKLIDYTNPDES